MPQTKSAGNESVLWKYRKNPHLFKGKRCIHDAVSFYVYAPAFFLLIQIEGTSYSERFTFQHYTKYFLICQIGLFGLGAVI